MIANLCIFSFFQRKPKSPSLIYRVMKVSGDCSKLSYHSSIDKIEAIKRRRAVNMLIRMTTTVLDP